MFKYSGRDIGTNESVDDEPDGHKGGDQSTPLKSGDISDDDLCEQL